MKVAIAGGTGFIGSHVVQHLVRSGHEVRLVARSRPPVVADGVDVVIAALEDPLDARVLEGCDVLVNLVGIAHAADAHAFERVHVDIVRRLLDAAQEGGVGRFVHVSVTDVPGTTGPYVESKRRGEQVVRSSALDWTILRPSMVYGEGDVALRNVIDGVRTAAVFPVPAGRTGSLQPVDVQDVAAAIERTLGGEVGRRETIDVVGPEHLDVRALVRRVGEALELPVRVMPLPRSCMWIAATIMELALSRPPLTRAQLGMLTSGLHGDPDATGRVLGVSAKPISVERIRRLADQAAPPPIAARLVTSAAHRAWLQHFRVQARVLPWLLPLVMMLFLGLSWSIPSVWASMGLANTITLAIVLPAMRRAPWKASWRPSWPRAAIGLGAAAVMLVGALGLVAILRQWFPELAAGADEVYAWANVGSPWIALPLLLAIVVIEDWVWRGAITLPLAAKLGPWVGCVTAGALFGAAHWAAGPPVLALAAFMGGTAWSLLAVRSRSLFTTACCHAAWDIAMLAISP